MTALEPKDFDTTYMEVNHGAEGRSLEATFFIAAIGKDALRGHFLEHEGRVAGQLYYPDAHKAGLFIGKVTEDGVLVTHVVREGHAHVLNANDMTTSPA